jgi:transposase
MDQVLGAMKGQGREEVTVVFDKGMNSEENITAIDAMEQAHFVTTYSTYYADELIHIDRSRFTQVDTPRNRELKKGNREDDMLTAWRTTGEYWGQERTVIVTYNPLTATKQRYGFERKLLRLQTLLFEMKSKVRNQTAQWRKKEQVLQRYHDVCSELHLPKDLYDLSFENEGKRLVMGFRKNFYRIGRHIDRFGKNIIITDHHDWSTDQIVQASLDRHIVEDAFRQSKHDDLVSLFPIRHWTDSKIRCHILSCIVALCYLRLIELRLQRAGLEMTAVKAMEQMHKLHFSAERLKVGIADPSLDDSFIAQILKLLEDHQLDHETDRLGRPANGAVEGGELLFEPLPGDVFGQDEQMILGIELIQKVLENEILLLLVDRFCPHGSHLMLYFPRGFLQK